MSTRSPVLTRSLPHPGGAGSPAWPGDPARVVGVSAAALAGGIHLAVVPEHLAESWVIGAFFLGLGLAQLVLAVLLRRPLRLGLVVAAVWAHLGVVALYVASRTADLPFLPPHDPGHEVEHLPVAGGIGNGIPIYPGSRIEPVGVLDVVCLVAELALLAVLVGQLDARRRARVTTVMVALASGAVLLRVLVLP